MNFLYIYVYKSISYKEDLPLNSRAYVCVSQIFFIFLGKNAKMEYGRLRLYGGIGFGLAALLTGYAVDIWSEGKVYKIYTPAFLFVVIFSCIDLICCRKFKVICNVLRSMSKK